MNNFKRKNPIKYEQMIQQICDIIGLEPDEVREAENINDDLGFDSIDEIELTIDCEDMFGISITDAEAESTNGDMIAICNVIQRALDDN